jgi:putative ABC transport system substrate-binding protein
MRRRDFNTLLGSAVAWTLADPALSQPSIKTSRVGLLTPSQAEVWHGWLVQALERLGYREGQNLALEVRSAEGRLERLSPLAEELIRAPSRLLFR